MTSPGLLNDVNGDSNDKMAVAGVHISLEKIGGQKGERPIDFLRRRKAIPALFAATILLLTYIIWLATPSTTYTPDATDKSSWYSPHSAGKTAISQNVAAIIDTRPLDDLVPLVMHFSAVLGPDWPIVIFTTQQPMPKSAIMRHALETKRVNIEILPSDVNLGARDGVSLFLTSHWFWETLAPAGHVLLFQADSIICANAPMRVEDFLQYDFVGAPINPNIGFGDVGMNGGLSLRNRTLVLDIITKFTWKDEPHNSPRERYEDQWYFGKMSKWEGARLPDPEIAIKFSVETMYYETPIGYHQIGRFMKSRIPYIEKYCPEYSLATNHILGG